MFAHRGGHFRNNYYAVVYDGIDPGTGRKRPRWVPAGTRRLTPSGCWQT